MKEAIRLAIKGGFLSDLQFVRFEEHQGSLVKVHFKQVDGDGYIKWDYKPSEFLQSHYFWMDLCKAAGLNDLDEANYDREPNQRYAWRLHWHRLVDHLAEGRSVETFFNNLLTLAKSSNSHSTAGQDEVRV